MTGSLAWIADRLGELFWHSAVLLAVVSLILPWIRQPALRMTLCRAALVGLLALAVLPAGIRGRTVIPLPDWKGSRQPEPRQARFATVNEDTESEPIDATESPDMSLADSSAGQDEQVLISEAAVVDAGPSGVAGATDRLSKIEPSAAPRMAGSEDALRPSWNRSASRAGDAQASFSLPWPSIASAAWIGGALLSSIWIGVGAWRTQCIKRRSRSAPEWIQRILRQIVPDRYRVPALRINDRIESAFACGALRPTILLAEHKAVAEPARRLASGSGDPPTDEQGLCAVLAHEWAHIVHGDLWLLALERLLLPVYFGQPLFWILRRRIRIDQEILADAAAAGDARVASAESLLAWAKTTSGGPRGEVLAVLPFWDNPCHLPRRIDMLLDTTIQVAPRASRIWRGTTFAMVFVLAAGLSRLTFGTTRSIAEPPADGVPPASAAGQAADNQPVAAPLSDVGEPKAAESSAIPILEARPSSPLSHQAGGTPDEAGQPRTGQASPVAAAGQLLPLRLTVQIVDIDLSRPAPQAMPLVDRERDTQQALAALLRGMVSDGQIVVARRTSKEATRLILRMKELGAAQIISNGSVQTLVRPPAVDQAQPAASDFDRGDALDSSRVFEISQADPRKPQITLKIVPVLLSTPGGEPLRMQLDVELTQRPMNARVQSHPTPKPPVSSRFVIEAASELRLGESLVIADAKFGSDRSQNSRAPLLVSITPQMVGVAEAEGTGASKPAAANFTALEQATKTRDHMTQRDVNAANAEKKRANAAEAVERQLLELDVSEAEVDLEAAQGAYDDIAKLHAKGVITATELNTRKLALKKAEIALRRAKLRLGAGIPPTSRPIDGGPTDGGPKQNGSAPPEGSHRVPGLSDLPIVGPLFEIQKSEAGTKPETRDESRNADGGGDPLKARADDRVSALRAAPTRRVRISGGQRNPLDLLASFSQQRSPLDEVNQVLARWEAATAKIRRVEAEFSRFVYDAGSQVETRSEGVLALESPYRAAYLLVPAHIDGQAAKKRGNDLHPLTLQTDPHEHGWLWTGRELVHVDLKSQTYESNPLPADGPSPSIDFEFLLARPFLLGMPAAELREQFDVALVKKTPSEVWLTLVPRTPERTRAFSQALLILGSDTWLPKALKLSDATGQVETVHTFQTLTLNGPPNSKSLDKPAFADQGYSELAWPQSTIPSTSRTLSSRAILPSLNEEAALLAQRRLGLLVSDKPAQKLTPEFAGRFRGGLKVESVEPDGPADKAGIRAGDVLVGIDVWETVRHKDLKYALTTWKPGSDRAAADNNAVLHITLARESSTFRANVQPRP